LTNYADAHNQTSDHIDEIQDTVDKLYDRMAVVEQSIASTQHGTPTIPEKEFALDGSIVSVIPTVEETKYQKILEECVRLLRGNSRDSLPLEEVPETISALITKADIAYASGKLTVEDTHTYRITKHTTEGISVINGLTTRQVTKIKKLFNEIAHDSRVQGQEVEQANIRRLIKKEYDLVSGGIHNAECIIDRLYEKITGNSIEDKNDS